MKRNWNEIKWIFEPDGSLRDIYVQNVSIEDWEKLIDLLNSKYIVRFGVNGEDTNPNQIDKEYVIEYLHDESGKMESKSVSIDIDHITMNCHFFMPDQIEFDIDPTEINSIEDFEKIENFMVEVSKLLENQVTLTVENSPKFPLIKIDFNNQINRVLTEKEAQEYWNKHRSNQSETEIIKTKLEEKLSSNKFKEKLLKSASEPYRSTKKNENIW